MVVMCNFSGRVLFYLVSISGNPSDNDLGKVRKLFEGEEVVGSRLGMSLSISPFGNRNVILIFLIIIGFILGWDTTVKGEKLVGGLFSVL